MYAINVQVEETRQLIYQKYYFAQDIINLIEILHVQEQRFNH